jgi:hypothetical protein
VKHNTPGKRDGEQAFWIDGDLRGHWKGFNWRQSATLWANALTLESYVTDNWTKNETNTVWFDNVVNANWRQMVEASRKAKQVKGLQEASISMPSTTSFWIVVVKFRRRLSTRTSGTSMHSFTGPRGIGSLLLTTAKSPTLCLRVLLAVTTGLRRMDVLQAGGICSSRQRQPEHRFDPEMEATQ